jgi:hypothetical protein
VVGAGGWRRAEAARGGGLRDPCQPQLPPWRQLLASRRQGASCRPPGGGWIGIKGRGYAAAPQSRGQAGGAGSLGEVPPGAAGQENPDPHPRPPRTHAPHPTLTPTPSHPRQHPHDPRPRPSCVVVEDSRIGLQAAKAAGMTCVVTKSSYTQGEDFTCADRVVDTLDAGGVTLDGLAALAAARTEAARAA